MLKDAEASRPRVSYRIDTRVVHQVEGTCRVTGAVTVPIYQVSTFAQRSPGQPTDRYDYSRTDNPTRRVLEQTVSDLEEGAEGIAFSSGMAALGAALMLLHSGDHVVATEGLYGGTYRILTTVLKDLGLRTTFVDTGDPPAYRAAFRPETRAVILETPSNPLMRISDIEGVAEYARDHNALLIVDNTFMSPVLQRPLRFGADIVVHSATKYLGGHSDVILGLCVVRDTALAQRLHFIQNAYGAVPSPLDCWLVLRGIKTLALRVRRAQDSALRIARHLSERPDVQEVYFPAFAPAAQAQIHSRQAEGPGAMLSFRVAPHIDAERLASTTKLWTLAVSLGAVESIITVPAAMTHGTYPPELRRRLGIDERLVRLSVGIEDPDDLLEDLARAFELAGKKERP